MNYFLTVGSILLKTNRADDAVRVAKRALSMAKTMQESATVGSFLRTAQQYQEYLAAQKQTEERVRAARSEHSDESAEQPKVLEERVTTAGTGPPVLRHRDELKPEAADRLEGTTRHRDEVKRGARDVLDGTIEQVTCSVPAALDLRLATSRQTVRLHSEDYFKVQFGAANFTPTGELHPCTELQGTRARVFFWHVQGAPYDGEIISVELRK